MWRKFYRVLGITERLKSSSLESAFDHFPGKVCERTLWRRPWKHCSVAGFLFFSIQAFKNTLWSFENFWRVLFLILFFRFEAVAQPPFYRQFLDFKVFSHFRKTQNWQQHLIFTNLNLLPLVCVCLSAVYLDNWSGYQLVIFICINKYIFFCFHTASFKMLTLSNHKCWKKTLKTDLESAVMNSWFGKCLAFR